MSHRSLRGFLLTYKSHEVLIQERIAAHESSEPKLTSKDTFVALTWDYRECIDDQFDQFVLDTREAWDRLFAPYTPFKGSNAHAYLSNIDLVV